MLKIYFTTFVALLLAVQAATAQITLTSANMPTAGITIYNDQVEPDSVPNLNIGLAGPDQTWNFSAATTLDYPQPTHYLAPASTPFFSSFPSASLAFTSELSDTAEYSYMKISATSSGLLGSSDNVSMLTFSPLLKIFQFPCFYEQTFSQISPVSGTSEGLSVSGNYSTNVEVDAYGNVTTQLGTFPCLRVKRISEINLTILFFNIIQKDTAYEWWTNQYKAPVFVYNRNSSELFGEIEYGSYASVLTEQSVPVSEPKITPPVNMQAAPNPTAEVTTISFELNRPGKTDLLVVDAMGKTVANYPLGTLGAGQYSQEVQLGSTPSGIYVVLLRQEGRLLGMKQLVKS